MSRSEVDVNASQLGCFRQARMLIRNSWTGLVHCRVKPLIYRALMRIAPATFHSIQHFRKHRKTGFHAYWMNLNDPRTFNEKTCVSKIQGEHVGYSSLVDKELVKEWAADRLGAEVVIPTISVFGAKEIKAGIHSEQLTFPCVFKPTHSSGRVLIVRSANEFNSRSAEIRAAFKEWVRLNHFYISGEPQYKGLEPKIICERLLEQNGSPPNDYKFFCFSSRPAFVQVDVDRHHSPKKIFYDMNWVKQEFTNKFPVWSGAVDRPMGFEKMIEFAKVLSNGFAFARVDFYDINGNIFFGEITFHHGSGYDSWTSYKHDLMLGQLLAGRSLL